MCEGNYGFDVFYSSLCQAVRFWVVCRCKLMLYQGWFAKLSELLSKLSVCLVLGQPKELNIVESLQVIFAVCVPVSCFSHAYPKNLSTVASHFFPFASNRSLPILSIGFTKVVGFVPTADGHACVCLSFWHWLHAAIACSMSFFMCGQS